MTPVRHHEHCFGCGQSNVFGLHLEAEHEPGGELAAEFVVRDSHAGPGGQVHRGVLIAALYEAMALRLHADGIHSTAEKLESDVNRLVGVGSAVELRAHLESDEGGRIRLRATAADGDGALGEASGLFRSEHVEVEA